MTKDEEQLIANIMYRMHANEQARLDAALSSARAESVARSEADRKRIEALTADLSKEREAHAETADLLNKASEKVRGLCVQAQDQREEIIRLNEAHGKTMVERDALRDQLDNAKRSALDAVLVLDVEEGESPNAAVRRIVKERDGMRAEVAEMRKHCDALRAEVAQLKAQTPKQHPVAVGEWVERISDAPWGALTQRAQVVSVGDTKEDYRVRRSTGVLSVWDVANCKPCDPPTEATHDTQEGRSVAESAVKVDPKPGDTVRLVRIPSRDVVSPELRTVLEWPWIERWGTLNQTAMVVEPLYQLDGAVIVCLSTNAHVRWPINCLEVVTEATHDTEAGKSAAESAAKTEPVADEIKVGDVVEVFQSTASCTFKTDIGTRGTVLQLDDSCVDTAPLDGFLAPKGNHVALCDVRKVTT